MEETPEGESPNARDVPRSLRTEWNVRDSDGTLILEPAGLESDAGTKWTRACAERIGKPVLVCDPYDAEAGKRIAAWVRDLNLECLNVAGPSEGMSPGIGEATYRVLVCAFTQAG